MADSLNQWLSLLEARHPVEIDLGLDRVAEVYYCLGDVRPAPRVVTVAGTNGKGSCVAVLDALLRAAGLSSATYTSPHLLRFNERISIDGLPVSDRQLCQAFQRVEDARGDISLTYFEFTTLAAFVLMSAAAVDVAVLEVGLGGRLDAVNVVEPDIAIITSIDLDHQSYLGTSRESVAVEKLGIARAAKPLLCGERDLPSNFIQLVAQNGCNAEYFGRDFHCHLAEHKLALPLPSVACALRAAELLCLNLPMQQMSQLIAGVSLSGRFQRIEIANRELILDVAHNPAAAAMLAEKLTRLSGPCVAVVAMMADKDMTGVIEPLLGHFDHWFLPPLKSVPRAAEPSLVAQLLYNKQRSVTLADSVSQGIELALESVGEGGRVVVFGSFFTVAAALQWREKTNLLDTGMD